MKASLLSLLTLFCLTSLTHAAESTRYPAARANQLTLNQLPEVLRQSINVHMRGGSNSAISNLLNVYPTSRDRSALAKKLSKAFDRAESDYGILIKVEPIFQRAVTSSYRQYFLLYGYREGVLFVRYDFYRSDKTDMFLDCELSRDPDEILPELSENVDY